MTDETEHNHDVPDDQPTEPDTSLNTLQSATPEYTLEDECIAVPKSTIGYLIETIELQALNVRKHGDPAHYQALCHRLAELHLAYQAHENFTPNGYGDPITITVPRRAFGLIFERAKMEHEDFVQNQAGYGVTDEFLDDVEGALNAADAARLNTVTGWETPHSY